MPRLHAQAAAATRKGPPPAGDSAASQDPPVDATSQRVAALLLDGRRGSAGKGSGLGPGSGAAAGDENADINCRAADVILPSPDRPPAAKSVWNIGPAGSPGAALAKPCRSKNPALAPRAAAPGGSRLGRKRKVEVGDKGAAAGGRQP